MPPIAATSPDAVIAHEVKNLIASSVTFIAAVGASNYIEAKESIYLLEKYPDTPLVYTRPFALVLLTVSEMRVSKPGYPSGQIEFQLEINALGGGASQDDEWTNAANFFGGVKSDISVMASPIAGAINDALLRMDRITQAVPYTRSRATADQDFWMTRNVIQFF